MNGTVKVASLYECDSIHLYNFNYNSFDPTWRQSVIGCKILLVLQQMYNFSISYVYDNLDNITVVGSPLNLSHIPKDWADVYLRPLVLRKELLTIAYPIQAIYPWRFGFLLRRPDYKYYTTFYSKPFIGPVWNWLCVIAIFVSILLYILKRWEYSILGGWECSFAYESLVIVGAYCQHIPPMDAKLPSRRIAYFIFFMFAYVVYTFYTSNLLSNLVNDKDHGIDLQTLADDDYEFIIVDYIQLSLYGSIKTYGHNITLLTEKLREMRSVSVPVGVASVLENKVALLSDYATIYPYIEKMYDQEDICKLITVDLISKTKKYLFTSKTFAYMEQFKVGLLRMQETGTLKRIWTFNYEAPHCAGVVHKAQSNIVQIAAPLLVLSCTYVVSLLIFAAELIQYKITKVYPYVN